MEDFFNCFNTIKTKINKIFGEPSKGIHSYRMFNVAIIDVLFTFIAAYIIQKIFYPDKQYYKILLILFILGIILHRLFDVRTTVDRLIFK